MESLPKITTNTLCVRLQKKNQIINCRSLVDTYCDCVVGCWGILVSFVWYLLNNIVDDGIFAFECCVYERERNAIYTCMMDQFLAWQAEKWHLVSIQSRPFTWYLVHWIIFNVYYFVVFHFVIHLCCIRFNKYIVQMATNTESQMVTAQHGIVFSSQALICHNFLLLI